MSDHWRLSGELDVGRDMVYRWRGRNMAGSMLEHNIERREMRRQRLPRFLEDPVFGR